MFTWLKKWWNKLFGNTADEVKPVLPEPKKEEVSPACKSCIDLKKPKVTSYDRGFYMFDTESKAFKEPVHREPIVKAPIYTSCPTPRRTVTYTEPVVREVHHHHYRDDSDNFATGMLVGMAVEHAIDRDDYARESYHGGHGGGAGATRDWDNTPEPVHHHTPSYEPTYEEPSSYNNDSGSDTSSWDD
jgi:hypothetical protein